ncbi:uncharacterized protein LOC117498012 [Trematomus bernacchii]|uniref:uncharacterized protein LOC117498012 n=1 Tax=Trematomus bernacchii TaxID=40690 RepID=UPI00146A8B7B|nr:uncharacterized protein LOC117498012 [Trematomus bernacchii]
MSDSEWMSRLRKFASTGAWPAGEGNRPAPRQKKWFELYQRIEKCPMQAHGQKSLFGQVQQCTCRFHPQKPAATPVQGAVGQQTAASGPVHRAVGQQSSAGTVQGAVGMGVIWGGHVAPTFPNPLCVPPPLSNSFIIIFNRRWPVIATEELDTASVAADLRDQMSWRGFKTGRTAQPQIASVPVLSPGAVSATVSAAASRTETDTASPVQLPRLWSEGLPPEDHKWILKSLLKLGPKGKLALQDHLKLWYFPPQYLYHY